MKQNKFHDGNFWKKTRRCRNASGADGRPAYEKRVRAAKTGARLLACLSAVVCLTGCTPKAAQSEVLLAGAQQDAAAAGSQDAATLSGQGASAAGGQGTGSAGDGTAASGAQASGSQMPGGQDAATLSGQGVSATGGQGTGSAGDGTAASGAQASGSQTPGSQDAAALSGQGASATGGQGTGTAGDGTAAWLYVHICGAVREPGVYRLPAGSRVYEGLQRAGGLLPEAAGEAVNQALALEDGMQIQIPTRTDYEASEGNDSYITLPADASQAVTPTDSTSSTGLVNINTADAAQLQTLNGIGESRAQSIIRYREAHGGFAKPEDIMKVEGIKEGAFAKIKEQITVK